MYTIKSCSFLFLCCFVFSCGQPEETQEPEQKSVENTEAAPQEESKPNNKVQLNDGEKWEANIETTEGIENMHQIIFTYMNAEDPVDTRCDEIHDELKEEFDLIFTNCTMTGDAHVQLHNYLIPVFGLFEKLEDEELTHCRRLIVQMDSYLYKYNTYFN